MKLKLYGIAASAIIMLPLCGCSNTDKGEEAAAQVEAAMMEGREAARVFVNRNWPDTVQLRASLEKARSQRARYDTLGLKRCAEAYDSGFVSTIRTINPKIASHLK